MKDSSLIPIERIEKEIYLIRGEKVMLDRDLAKLYEVTTAALNQVVRRNLERFPSDVMFQLTRADVVRDPRSKPFAFTEHGILMLSSVLNSERAFR